MRKENIKVGENDQCVFYANSFTETLTKYCSEDNVVTNIKGLTRYYVLLATTKSDNSTTYILCHNERGVVYDTTLFEGMCYYIDALKLLSSENEK